MDFWLVSMTAWRVWLREEMLLDAKIGGDGEEKQGEEDAYGFMALRKTEIHKILVYLDFWDIRNHDPPVKTHVHIPKLTYDDDYFQLPFTDV